MSNTAAIVGTTTDTPIQIPELAPELLRGPVWLKRRREKAREYFNSQPLPRRGLHLWRYTDPAVFEIRHDQMVDSAFREKADDVEKLEMKHLEEGSISGLVISHGGRDITVHAGEELKRQKVVVSTLSDAIASHPQIVESRLFGLVNETGGKFEALNCALFNDGIFVYVPRGTTLSKPVHLLREAGNPGSAQFPRTLIVVEENAEITVIDEYAGGADDIDSGVTYSNGAVEIFGGQDSRTRYVMLQRQGRGTNSYLTHRARIERGASMLTFPLAFGANLSKQNFGVTLNGPGADSQMYGVLFGTGRQHFDNHTLHHHSGGNTHSDIDMKVVLRDRAMSAYTGLIRIEQFAKTCEAYQENRNLLLNRGTRAETIPELEILNEDVQCSHGATIGPIDPEQVFYLGARGIDPEQAVRMIVRGFFEDSLSKVPEDLRQRIDDYVISRLEGL
jgi:Fe-S cluster assembly protein SufD